MTCEIGFSQIWGLLKKQNSMVFQLSSLSAQDKDKQHYENSGKLHFRSFSTILGQDAFL